MLQQQVRPASLLPHYVPPPQPSQQQEHMDFIGFNTSAADTAWRPASPAVAPAATAAPTSNHDASAAPRAQRSAAQWPQLSVTTCADACKAEAAEPTPTGRPQRAAAAAKAEADASSSGSGGSSPSKRKRRNAATASDYDDSPPSPPKLSRVAARTRAGRGDGAATAHVDAAPGSATSAFRGVSRHRCGALLADLVRN